jgi:hypothetical protein
MGRQLGFTIGVAVAVAIFGAAAAAGLLDSFRQVSLASAGLAMLAAASSIRLGGARAAVDRATLAVREPALSTVGEEPR